VRVALDVTALDRPGSDRGIGRYVRAVRAANGLLGNDLVEVTYAARSGRVSELSGLLARRVALARAPFDVFHAPTAYHSLGGLLGRRSVVSMLDLIPLELAEHRRTGVKARVFHRLGASAGAILTLSEHTAGRVVEVLGVPRERVVVAPLAPEPAFVPDGPSLAATGPYVAAMVDLRTPDPRKRAPWIEVLARRLEPSGFATVVVGPGTERLRQAGLDGRGSVTDEEWAQVLRGATLFAYTSEYEGQGLPPLEAIACGTPVVAMDNSAMPEVVGPAGRLVAEQAGAGGADRLADEVLGLLSDPAALTQMRASCARHAASFSPDRFVRALGTAYELAAGER
jgi:glycosyltransferase involved in cell wall biosynthesis